METKTMTVENLITSYFEQPTTVTDLGICKIYDANNKFVGYREVIKKEVEDGKWNMWYDEKGNQLINYRIEPIDPNNEQEMREYCKWSLQE